MRIVSPAESIIEKGHPLWQWPPSFLGCGMNPWIGGVWKRAQEKNTNGISCRKTYSFLWANFRENSRLRPFSASTKVLSDWKLFQKNFYPALPSVSELFETSCAHKPEQGFTGVWEQLPWFLKDQISFPWFPLLMRMKNWWHFLDLPYRGLQLGLAFPVAPILPLSSFIRCYSCYLALKRVAMSWHLDHSLYFTRGRRKNNVM